MKKLKNTLFVLSEDVYVTKDGDNVVIRKDDVITGRYVLRSLDNIICFNYAGASPSVMDACGEFGVGLSFLSPRGKFLAHVVGMNNGNVLLRREQYRIADDKVRSVLYARMFLFGKVYNAYQVLDRACRNHALRVDVENIRQTQELLKIRLHEIIACTDDQVLRGLEGEAAQLYFRHFDELILQQKDDFYFSGRNKRPPLDRINAMLSYVYVILSHECASALESVGLDAYVGFLHTDRPGRASLALDLIEELRAFFCDRFVLTLVNKQMIHAKHFVIEDTGAVFLSDEGKKIVLSEWMKNKQIEIEHPYLKEKISWGLVPYVQAMLLARCIRGDMDAYVPFLWR